MDLPDLPRFYVPSVEVGERLVLDEEEFRHARVLRLEPDSKVHLINGKGALYNGFITIKKRAAEILVDSVAHEKPEPSSALILGIAPTKNISRFEWVVEKATELGVSAIYPILCEHSERDRLKLDRLQKIVISAMKQSKRLWMPKLMTLSNFHEVLSIDADEKFIAHCHDEQKLPISSLSHPKKIRLVLVGPEGDFSNNEIDQAKKSSFQSISLGEARLRTETAAIAICVYSNLASNQ
ncbi:MAG: 16S rRNA (uracil(1498)-N(3))-methyltransferase [Salibacteraceae bacterium]